MGRTVAGGTVSTVSVGMWLAPACAVSRETLSGNSTGQGAQRSCGRKGTRGRKEKGLRLQLFKNGGGIEVEFWPKGGIVQFSFVYIF